MPKLDKHYLSLAEFLSLSLKSSSDGEPRFINRTIFMDLPHERGISLDTQLKGAFQPLADMAKDAMDTFKPYRSWWYVRRDALQPIFGIGNVFKGIGYVLASLLLFICAPFYCFYAKNSIGWHYAAILLVSWNFALSCFIDGILRILRGATQLVTTPLTCFKALIRGSITLVDRLSDKRHLAEQNEGIKKLFHDAFITFSSGDYEATYNYLEKIHEKYLKAVDPKGRNQDTQIKQNEQELRRALLSSRKIEDVIEYLGDNQKDVTQEETTLNKTSAQAYMALFAPAEVQESHRQSMQHNKETDTISFITFK